MRTERFFNTLAITLGVITLIVIGCTIRPAWSQAIGTDVPATAKDEINRRGNMVQITGDIRADGTDLIAEAFAVPADDSHKWYLSIVTQSGCPPCEVLKTHILKDPELQKWVNVTDQSKSWAHYQVYNYDRVEIRPKFAALVKLPDSPFHADGTIEAPIIIVQPPRNGDFGKPSNVVVMRAGYDGDPKKLSDFLRTSVARYVMSQQNDGIRSIQALTYRKEVQRQMGQEAVDPAADAVEDGVAQQQRVVIPQAITAGGGRDAPYRVQPKQDDFMPSGGPFEIPGPAPRPKYMGLSDVRTVIPDAPTDYLLDAVDRKYTDPDAVLYDWLREKGKRDKAVIPVVPDTAKKVVEVASHPAEALWEFVVFIVHFICVLFNTVSTVIVIYMLYLVLKRQSQQTPTLAPLIPAEYAQQWAEALRHLGDKVTQS